MPKHTVEQGEYLSQIAKKYGFADYRTIWDHPENAELKKKRQNPSVLFPGDQLFVPARDFKEESGSTEQKHRFQAKQGKLMLRLVLESAYFKPIADAPCELTVEGEMFKLVSDAEGKIEKEIPATTKKATVVIKDPLTAINDAVVPIKIGDLDPVEEVSGQKARLNNLGYFAGPLNKQDEALFHSAVEEFQCEHMGPSAVDGKCGPKTQAKLKEVHGC
ncbi:MAG: peptidoglycan-binding protein [Acidobacteria bacterium]|nr:peptidoglycan-binding protein [Acidobacteriota bacterium]